MGVEYLICALIAFMLIAVLIAVETRDLLSSVISLGAAGFALSVIDLLAGAPDLAITQVVVEVIALVLLVRVVLTRTDSSIQRPRDTLRTAAVLLAGGVFLCAVFAAIGGLRSGGGRGPQSHYSAIGGPGTMPPFGQPVLTHAPDAAVPPGVGHDYLAGAEGQTGAANVVTAILLDYRAYDTLGEATIIFAAVLGTYTIIRRVGRRGGGRSGEAEEELT